MGVGVRVGVLVALGAASAGSAGLETGRCSAVTMLVWLAMAMSTMDTKMMMTRVLM
jgi:hypothetical protein